MFYQLRFFNPSASEALISTQAGIIVGSKTAAQVCTGMLWGRLADSEYGGRKTVLMIGLICSGMSRILNNWNEIKDLRHLMHWIRIIKNIRLCCGVASFWWCYE
jgi:MFS family permease